MAYLGLWFEPIHLLSYIGWHIYKPGIWGRDSAALDNRSCTHMYTHARALTHTHGQHKVQATHGMDTLPACLGFDAKLPCPNKPPMHPLEPGPWHPYDRKRFPWQREPPQRGHPFCQINLQCNTSISEKRSSKIVQEKTNIQNIGLKKKQQLSWATEETGVDNSSTKRYCPSTTVLAIMITTQTEIPTQKKIHNPFAFFYGHCCCNLTSYAIHPISSALICSLPLLHLFEVICFGFGYDFAWPIILVALGFAAIVALVPLLAI